MARLVINSYDGDNFLTWFNDEITGKRVFDVSEWVKAYSKDYKPMGLTEDQMSSAWSLNKGSIRFSVSNVPFTVDNNGSKTTEYHDIFVSWAGKFKIKGDAITGGSVSGFTRDWGPSCGNIGITGFTYNLTQEMGSLWGLTLPSEMTTHFRGTLGDPQYNQYGELINSVEGFLRTLPAGSFYDFITPYG